MGCGSSTPLPPSSQWVHYAATNQLSSLSTALSQAGPNLQIDQRDKKSGDTALLAAARNGHSDCVSFLTENGADRKLVDSAGRSALMLAAAGGHLAALRVLLGGDVDQVNRRSRPGGSTALILAAAGGHFDCVAALVEAGADVSVTNDEGLTATQVATNGGFGRLVLLLNSRAASSSNDDDKEAEVGAGEQEEAGGSQPDPNREVARVVHMQPAKTRVAVVVDAAGDDKGEHDASQLSAALTTSVEEEPVTRPSKRSSGHTTGGTGGGGGGFGPDSESDDDETGTGAGNGNGNENGTGSTNPDAAGGTGGGTGGCAVVGSDGGEADESSGAAMAKVKATDDANEGDDPDDLDDDDEEEDDDEPGAADMLSSSDEEDNEQHAGGGRKRSLKQSNSSSSLGGLRRSSSSGARLGPDEMGLPIGYLQDVIGPEPGSGPPDLIPAAAPTPGGPSDEEQTVNAAEYRRALAESARLFALQQRDARNTSKLNRKLERARQAREQRREEVELQRTLMNLVEEERSRDIRAQKVEVELDLRARYFHEAVEQEQRAVERLQRLQQQQQELVERRRAELAEAVEAARSRRSRLDAVTARVQEAMHVEKVRRMVRRRREVETGHQEEQAARRAQNRAKVEKFEKRQAEIRRKESAKLKSLRDTINKKHPGAAPERQWR